ncbi:1-(5-phosphoribosyl)-5-[(5-phosphoribosylamino)methylideneamino]imidazole-4-carboxamide isomerase [Rhodohalobacter sulfatireducens]|uniref:1-(5-phosphoribosyl)-5-[(5-phosphoribosylamino)methylideneamino] imidazole-4-carboxamide isomerase n=1 Tax=Rhodohalobacter sulfatireducens TaxID=2911366 RepID=A0ABS9K9A7_9BACT|nr:1-(5-phosphoribosyl)-5-[(5-phosphoribosylamino)methylideneamino]imidazole-4-carboxamide isomerase [Rhodohalobacter sulfatireducens]MCG2587403.1 1-(5-phosphoribosyl)-5-[(5-phosphoribosylamino)methylideneamino]imidazole-4-carboxamide isomerase [Rhodohalobacter sulfatireducens]
MKIIPAIDLLDGQVVRLQKGDYQKKTVYNDNPVQEASKFKEAGFNHIHVVDLNGAKSGKFENLPLIQKIIDTTGLSVQTGGGVRSKADVELLLEAGLSGIICSSMAVKKPKEWIQAINNYPEQMILGLDLKDGKMAYGGWLETSDQSIAEFLKPMMNAGLQTVLSTDISRDGMLSGPNVQMYQNLQHEFPELNWIASGGVSKIDDLEELISLNIYGVVVGKAYYEGRIGLEELSAM